MPHDTDTKFSRRGLLQAAAGGVTFLALAPRVSALLPPHEPLVYEPRLDGQKGPMPLFTALPYLQAGPEASKLVDGSESMIVAWQTNGVTASFAIDVDGDEGRVPAAIRSALRKAAKVGESDDRINYAATVTGMRLGRKYRYSVSMNGQRLFEGYFTTRAKRGKPVRFVAFGDNSYGEISDRQIAYQAYKARPDFVMNTGDNVYESGLDNEYSRYFFPVYNADVAGPRLGAPLLRSVPFYTIIGNHDVHGKDDDGHPCGDFRKVHDALAYYTNMYLPQNGPRSATPTAIIGPDERLNTFRDLAGGRFPVMANYSYDYGDAHFTCLDSNTYVDPTDPALQSWIEEDLKNTDATWRFVVYHHPAFNVGEEHYAEQQMRAISPILEAGGVDFVLHGHEHTYQRTMPLRFAPSDLAGAKKLGSGHRIVPGKFTLDTRFDGKTVTKPDGVLYITTGAGGKHLYDPKMNMLPSSWLHEEDDNVAYVARFVSDRHSLSLFDVEPHQVRMTQIDEWGEKIDEIVVTK